MNKTRLVKFSSGEGLAGQEYDYGNVFAVGEAGAVTRLAIGPSTDQIALMLRLAEAWGGDYYLLYILLLSRGEKEDGRYQSPLLSFEQVSRFCSIFSDFIETDGRHHFWIASIDRRGLLVYDQHNIIWAYGDLETYTRILTESGFKPGVVDVPFPHSHHFHVENDDCVRQVLDNRAWQHSPLQPGDY